MAIFYTSTKMVSCIINCNGSGSNKAKSLTVIGAARVLQYSYYRTFFFSDNLLYPQCGYWYCICCIFSLIEVSTGLFN